MSRSLYRGQAFALSSTVHGGAATLHRRKNTASRASQKPLSQCSEFYWTKLISELTQRGHGRDALTAYKEMREEGVLPKSYTFVAALKACCSIADLQSGKQIHSHVIASAQENDLFVASTLLHMYAKCGSIIHARRVFEQMPHHNVVSWTAIITAYTRLDMAEPALQLFARMQNEGFTPNAHTFAAALKACSALVAQEEDQNAHSELTKARCLVTGRAIHNQVTDNGFESDMFVASALVTMYAKCGSIAVARQIFDRMGHSNLVCWNAIILGYAQLGMGEPALQLYARMQMEGFAPNTRMIVAGLKACSSLVSREEGKEDTIKLLKIRCLERGRAIHNQAVKDRFETDMFVANALMDMYVKCGSIPDARSVFERMLQRDVVSWNTMIIGYAQMDMGESGLQLYIRMQREGFTPDVRTFVAALKACTNAVALETGREIHVQIRRAELESDAFVASCLIDMYNKCGSMADTQQCFNELPTKCLVTWSALIAGYSDKGDSKHVFDLLIRMQQEGICPDGVTFLSVLAVCSHTGLMDKGQNCFQTMCSEFGIIPTIGHYKCMFDLLARAGQLDEAVATVGKMPFNLESVTWTIILGACRKWNCVETGRHAFECTLHLDRKQAAAYMLMTNIYVSNQMWEESVKVQKMRANGPAL